MVLKTTTILKTRKFKRTVQVERVGVRASKSEDDRTVDLAFSSEAPVDRYFGQEVLDHQRDSVDLEWFNGGTAPLLLDHNPENQIGVIENARIDSDLVGRATVRFSKNKHADEILRDIRDGIKSNISVGYRLKTVVREEKDGGREIHRALNWQPLEISVVSIPADMNVGVGRGDNCDEFSTTFKGNRKMEDDTKVPQAVTARTVSAAVAAVPTVDTATIQREARDGETTRVQDILAMGEQHGQREMALSAVKSRQTVAEFGRQLLDELATTTPSQVRHVEDSEIGLTEQESDTFSFVRAITALSNPTDRRAQDAAKFEYECSDAAASKLGRESRGITVPVDVLKRELVVGTATAGGNLVATNLLTGSFIDMLRNNTVVLPLTTQLTDLVGNIAIPRQTGGTAAYWVAESASPTTSDPTFDQVALSPNTVGARTDIARKLLLQGGVDTESFVRGELSKTLGLELDRAVINGSGIGNEPTGILNTTGIGSVVGGANGAAPTYADVISLETQVSQANADVNSMAYVTNAKVRGKLKGTAKAPNTAEYVWEDAMLNGYNALTTNQVPSNLTKGTSSVCSAIIFGNFADVIVGMWGGLDLTVDPYTNATSGGIRIIALQDIDISVRHAESFSAMKDALTA